MGGTGHPPAWVDFTAGTVAGAASLFCGHPFDTIKVVLQCSHGQRRTSLQTLRTLISTTGVTGLYRGVSSPLLGVAAVNSLVFGSYGVAMRYQLESPSASPSLVQVGLAGSVSGVVTALLTTPIERLKILQQSAPPATPQPTIVSLLRQMSIRRLYRGFTATVLRDIGYGPYFLTYEAICRGWPGRMRNDSKADLLDEIDNEARTVSWPRLFVAGAAAGIVGWTVTFPLDVVKSKLQATERTASDGSPTRYSNLRQTVLHTYKEGGIRAFVSGIGPTILRAVPVNVVTFLTFEATVTALSGGC